MALEAVIQLASIALRCGKSRHPGAGRDPCPSSRGAFRGGTATETVQIQVLAELWVPAAAGMAKEARVEITALLVEGNWITAAKAESQISSSPPAGRGEREALGTARRAGRLGDGGPNGVAAPPASFSPRFATGPSLSPLKGGEGLVWSPRASRCRDD